MTIDPSKRLYKIGVFGAGNIGATIARKLVAAGHSVKLAGSEGPDDIRGKAAELGAIRLVAQDAVKDVAAIIHFKPVRADPHVAGLFTDVLAGEVVIDTSNLLSNGRRQHRGG